MPAFTAYRKKDGGIEQSNFHEYTPIRLADVPPIIHLYVFAITDRKSGTQLPFGIAFDITEKSRLRTRS